MNGRNAAASIAPIGATDECTQPMDNCDARTDGQTDRQTDARPLCSLTAPISICPSPACYDWPDHNAAIDSLVYDVSSDLCDR